MGIAAISLLDVASAQVTDKGLSPPANTARSFQDASIARDSGINQPLDLLNDFYPSITVTIADHDNVRRRPDFDENDIQTVISPSLAYRTNIGRHQFYAAYTGVFIRHDDLQQEDAESNSLRARAGFDVSSRWDIDVFAGFDDSFEQRGVSGAREFSGFVNNGLDSGPEETEQLSYGADLIYGRKLEFVTAVLGFERSEIEFLSDDLTVGQLADDRDREKSSWHIDLSWRFAKNTSIFGRIQQTDISYDRPEVFLDSEQVDALLGLRWRSSNVLSGAFAVGQSDRDFDDTNREGFDGNIYYANLSYRISPFSTIQLNASRVVEEPGDIDSSFYESELFGLGWDHAITPRLLFNAHAKWVDDDYDTGREDSFVDWGLELDYAWRRLLTVGVFYGEVERESTLENVDYDDAFFGVRLSSDLRSLLQGRGKRKFVEPASFPSHRRLERVTN